MARQEGTYKFGSNLEPKFNAPVDARLVVPTKTDLYTMQYPYRGMKVYVQDEDAEYKLVNDLPAYEASWVLCGQTETVIDLSGYVQETDLVEITEAEIDAMFA